MKKIISYITLILVTCAVITGCMPEKADTALEYKGPTVLEFKNFTLGQGTTQLAGKGVSTATADAQTDSTHTVMLNTRGTDSILVQLVGPQSTSPIVVNYSVRSGAAYTAVEGTHYNFIPTGARTVTIAPNTSSAYILISPIPNSLPTVGNTVLIGIDLLGASGIAPSANFKVFLDKLKR